VLSRSACLFNDTVRSPCCTVLNGRIISEKTWSLTLREEHGVRVFENRVLRRIFGPKRDEVTGGWRKLHNEELHNLYSSPSIILTAILILYIGFIIFKNNCY
jgi:hypothetical protein